MSASPVQGGVPDVLVTNEVVGRQKLRRLAALAHMARVGVCADDPSQIRALDEAAGEAGVTLPVYVEINMGGNRCGIEPGEPALALARQITQASHLTFGGLHAYHGSAQHLRGWDERRQAIAQAAGKAGRIRELLVRHGIECPAVTGAGTGTSSSKRGAASTPNCNAAPTSLWTPITAATSTATAPRPRPSSRASSCGRESRRRPERARLRLGAPLVCDEPAATYERASDEHGRLGISGATNRLQIGDKIRLVPGHCGPTVNLYDWCVAILGNRVEQLCQITARGVRGAGY